MQYDKYKNDENKQTKDN